MVHNLKVFYQDQPHKMKCLEEIESSWSHDVWSFGIVLLEIISGCPIDKTDTAYIQSRLEKATITKGLFALPRLVLDNKEPCQLDEDTLEHDCKIVKKKFFQALDSIHQNFLFDPIRTIKQKDFYNWLEDRYLHNLIGAMLQEDPKKRISPQEIIDHEYFNTDSKVGIAKCSDKSND